MSTSEQSEKTRLDKWLWAARFYKTRALAAEAIDGGKIQVNGEKSKRSKLIQVGDKVRVRNGPFETSVTVTGVSERRGSATLAAELYHESEESKKAREEVAAHVRSMRIDSPNAEGRPTKRDRRDIDKARGRF